MLNTAQAAAERVLPGNQVLISQPDPGTPQFVAHVSRITGTELTELRNAYTLPLDSLVLRWTDPVESPQTEQRDEFAVAVRKSWSEVLKVDSPRPNDDFFEIGGTSLHAAILANRLSNIAGQRVTMRVVMDSLSLEDLTLRVAEIAGRGSSCDDRGS